MTISNPLFLRTSGKSILVALATAACTLTSSLIEVRGDTIILNSGDTLTGKIQSMGKGAVVLQSPLTPKPLEIKADSIRSIKFPKQENDNLFHTERLTLANNDIVPCKVISLDKEQLHISTWYAGKFSIPRTNIKTLQFGLSEEKLIFEGNDAPSKWITRNGSWSFSGTSYSSRSSGTLARELDLPENVRINFTLTWKETPNFSFRFCAENDSANTKQDTYEFLFNSAGMQILRYENARQPAAPITNISIKPRSISNQRINIDLRVNRNEGLVSLYIDSKFIGTWPDSFTTSKGNYIIFNNRTNRKNSCTVSDIKVMLLRDGTLPRHREKNGATQADVLIDSEGEKMSGILTSISEGEINKRNITFNVKHATKPLNLPDRRVSSLLFAQPDKLPQFPNSTFTAILHEGGRLQLENPKLVNGKLTSIHPILGPCTLSPKVLSHIRKSTTGTHHK